MPQRNDRSRSTPTTSPKNNSWFRMQAGHQNFRMQSFSDVWMDAQFASLKALIVRMVSGSSDAAVADFSLLPEENGIPERTDEELMHLGEGISGGVRYGPDSQPGH